MAWKKKLIDKLIGFLSIIFRTFSNLLEKYIDIFLILCRQAYWKVKLKEAGSDIFIGRYVIMYAPENIRVGNNISIHDFTHIWGVGGVEIGDNTMIACHVVISSLTHDKDAPLYRGTLIKAPVKIGKNVWVGAGAIILPGVIIGDDAIIGAGAVVTRNVQSGSIVVGVPAKPMS
jgi:maltose O-acetyltransferase